MKAYKYNSDSGVYMGEHDLQIDPVGGGYFDPPPFCTKVKPPETDKWFSPFWNGSEWEVKPDNLGRRIYSKVDGSSVYCSFYEIPEGYVSTAPDVELPTWDGDKWIVDSVKKNERDNIIAKSELMKIDDKTVRALRSVLIAVVNGATIPEEDFSVLTQNEQRAVVERDKLK